MILFVFLTLACIGLLAVVLVFAGAILVALRFIRDELRSINRARLAGARR